jgi:hypothetical protein
MVWSGGIFDFAAPDSDGVPGWSRHGKRIVGPAWRDNRGQFESPSFSIEGKTLCDRPRSQRSLKMVRSKIMS